MTEDIDLDRPFQFRATKMPLPADMRPIWRISVVLLILFLVSRGKKASINKLHLLSAVIRSQRKADKLAEIIEGNASESELVVRFDPTLNKALEIGRAEGLLVVNNGKTVSMSAKGIQLVESLMEDPELFSYEKTYLKQFNSSQLSEKLIDSVLSDSGV